MACFGGDRRVSLSRLSVLCLLLIASAWVALINGQPFFMADTSAYVREPDFAAVYFLGPKFATSWTQDRTLQGRNNAVPQTAHRDDPPLNSPFEGSILAGRSIYYGALLYLGHLTSYFWLSVFLQAAIFLYLSYTLVITCLRMSFLTFVGLTLAILIAAPVSFFISFLMPDVFASFLILAMIIFVGFLNVIGTRDKVIISGIILYSALAHTSHLLLLVFLGFLFGCAWFFNRRKAKLADEKFPQRAIILFALILAGLLSELGFAYAARHTIGVEPIRPPFVMARLIADGPGYNFLLKNCATKPYAVCRFIERLPIPVDAFLWSADPVRGVFGVADLPTRRALSSEQISFALDVFRSDPVGVISHATVNFVRQLIKVGVNEFFPTKSQLQYLKGKMPASYFEQLLRSPIVFHDWILTLANSWYSFFYYLSLTGLVSVWVSWPWLSFPNKSERFPQPQWSYVLTIAVMAIFVNAAICGTLSEPHPRYQTRIAWIPLFVLLLTIAKLWEAVSPSKNKSQHDARAVSLDVARPL